MFLSAADSPENLRTGCSSCKKKKKKNLFNPRKPCIRLHCHAPGPSHNCVPSWLVEIRLGDRLLTGGERRFRLHDSSRWSRQQPGRMIQSDPTAEQEEQVLRDLLVLDLVVARLKGGTSGGYCCRWGRRWWWWWRVFVAFSVVNMIPSSPCWTDGSIRSSMRLTSEPRFLILKEHKEPEKCEFKI